ncbi:hypothetical protein PHJA_002992500 [Phtheirospermum japonicum]|uniref:Uncharacterized protein n=1 Tax=Phtheirospermum japonicum TaxID=374723 RepID=A0A830DKU2_9LAMI|nr:hypothetical protein PHJA_002992500 [Phtheirospermum japonicum]
MFRRLAPRSQSIARLCSNEHSTSFSFGGTGIRPYSMKKSDVHKHRQFDVQEEVAWTPPEKGKGKLNTSSTISGEGSSGGGVFADLDRGEIVFAYFEYYPPDQTL